MINTSLEYKKALENDKRIFLPKVSIQLSDNDKTVLEIGGANIMQGGLKIDDGTSNQGSFDIGAAIINKLTLNINNIYDDYSLYDSSNAVVTVFVGLQLTNRIEWLKKGVFNADDPRFNTSIITLECLDNMKKFDKQYDGKLGFPATLQTIINYCCSKCGVILNTNQFDNYTYKVYESPFGANEPVTYREIISYCAQIAGCYARCNTDGYLELKWYDTSIISKMGGLDGGNYIDNRSGDSADGGNFIDYTSGNAVDGGNFSGLTEYSHLYSLSSPQIATDDVVITGISVTASDKLSSENTDKNTEGETHLSGSSGYVLKIQNNPLIEYGRASDVANYLGSKINGMKFRPMSVLALGNPAIEAGDCVVITDRKSNSYYSYITNLNYSLGAQESFSCDAETPARNSSQRYSEMTKAVVEARKNTQKQLSQYDLVAQQLGSLMANAVGMYETTTVDESDGSVIRYMHDKPKLKDSRTIWKQTIDAFAVSTDGGVTWPYGHDKNGNVLATVLTAIGINADWIKAGVITGVEINNGNGTFKVDSSGNTTANNLRALNAQITGGSIYLEGSMGTGVSFKMEGRDKKALIYSDGIIFADKDNSNTSIAPRYGASGFSFYGKEFGAELTENGAYEAPIGGKVYGIIISKPRNGGYLETVRITQNGIAMKDLRDTSVNSISINNEGSVTCNSIVVRNGKKSKCVETLNYGNRLLYCYETPSPIFGDIGRAVLDNTGTCYIYLDDVFSETIDFDYAYNVFTQKYGQGDLWVSELQPLYFVIKGTPGMEFAWEVKAKQVGHGMDRLETYSIQPETKTFDYADEAVKYIKEYEKELLNYE